MIREVKQQIKFLRGLAQVLSFCFHPLLLPTYLIAIIAFDAPMVLNPVSESGRKNLILVIFISTFLLPVFILLSLQLVFNRQFKISDIFLIQKHDRVLPFTFTGVYFLTLSYFLFSQLSQVLFVVMLGISMLILITGTISLVWKISAHATGLAGVLGFLLMISYTFPVNPLLVPAIICIIISGMVMTARLYLNAHTPNEVLGGTFFGLAGSMGIFVFLIH